MQACARTVVRAPAVAEHVEPEFRIAERIEIGRPVYDLIGQSRIDFLERCEGSGAGRVGYRVEIARRLSHSLDCEKNEASCKSDRSAVRDHCLVSLISIVSIA